jgi:hypothetical protein
MKGINDRLNDPVHPDAITLRNELKRMQWDNAPQNNDRGAGQADTRRGELEYPFLVWKVENEDEEEYTFDNNTIDYYQDIIVSFTIASNKKSGAEAQTLLSLVKNLFRNQQIPLPSGRVLCCTIGTGSSGRTPDNDGQTAIGVLTFETGT